VLDIADGNELMNIDPAGTELTLHHLIECGFFNDDGIADYLIYGYTASLEPALSLMDGNTGSVKWIEPAHFSIYDSDPLAVLFDDMNADGLDDILIISESNLTITSGIDGKIIWETSLNRVPEHLLTGDRMESGNLNIAYVREGALYAMSLSYEVADEEFPVIYIVLLTGAIIATVVILTVFRIGRRKPSHAEEKPLPNTRTGETPPT
jgi:hypothetical protein